MQTKYQDIIHRTFEAGIFLKGLNGVFELIGGILLLLIKPTAIQGFVALLTEGELSHDPSDFVANFFVHSAQSLSVSAQLFGALFLLSHGIIKLALIAALYKRKLWAYPSAILVFGLFGMYQMYRYVYTASPWLIALTALDIIIIVLTGLEYGNLKRGIIPASRP